MNKSVLTATGLCKSYHDVGGKIHVLDHLNLTLYAGEMIAIVGSSGSGKSTLLHVLGGLDNADQGSIMINNREIMRLSEKEKCQFRNQHLGFIYQFHHLLPEFTILDNVSMPLWIGHVNKKEAKKRSLEMLERVGLATRVHHRMSELSGGERQRAAIARALVTRPACVLADELTGNLDRTLALKIVDLMKELTQEMQSTMVLVTHDLTLAALCDKQYTMRSGKVWLE
ncbi:MAG: ABC transporter ATP-binding protein [Pseudomonadota bacterium]